MKFELFTAMYKPESNEIVGCTEGTIVWHHEDRHRQQYNSTIGKRMYNLNTFLVNFFTIPFCLFALIWWRNRGSFLAGAGFFMIPYAVWTSGLEIDAWIYAFIIKIKEKINNGR